VAATVKEVLADIGDSAKEKSSAFIDSWLEVFPEFEAMGLQITNFGVAMSLVPSMEVELAGPAGLFDDGKLEVLREEYKDNSKVSLVLRAIKSTKLIYQKMGKYNSDEIFIKIRVKIPPEIGVYFGRPAIP